MEEPVAGLSQRVVGSVEFGGAVIGLGPLGFRTAMETVRVCGRGQFQKTSLQGVGIEPGATRFLEQLETIGHEQGDRGPGRRRLQMLRQTIARIVPRNGWAREWVRTVSGAGMQP